LINPGNLVININRGVMNLLYSITAYPPSIGGAQQLMHQLAVHLAGEHKIQVITHWDTNRTDWLLGTTINTPGPEKKYVIDGIPVHRIVINRNGKMKLSPWVAGYYLVQGAAIGKIASLIEGEMVSHAKSVDLVHNCRVGREGLSYASYSIARKKKIPFVITPVHHPRWGGWLHRYYIQLYRKSDAVIALTHSERNILSSLGIEKKKIFVTGNSSTLAASSNGIGFRERYKIKQDPVVLFLGQKYPYKGFNAILESSQLVWNKFPETRFLFIGPRTKFSRRVFPKYCQDDRIIELGAVSLQEKTDALAACDILCVPSTQESFGGVFIEAWEFGKPVIGGKCPAVSEVIDDGREGFLVNQDFRVIADRIVELLGNPKLAKDMGDAGRNKAKQKYSWDVLAQKTIEIYNTI
jgi:glycosyltransferase involved in cell wall biosynthesis